MLKNILKTSSKILSKKSFVKNSHKFAVINNNTFIKRNYAKQSQPAAVLLSGCGYLDGTEVTEAVSCLIQLQKAGYSVDCFAPPYSQEKTFDHATGKLEKNEIRTLESESARIARKILPISKLTADSYGLLVIPGGFGVGRNLSSYADDGVENFTVKKEVEDVLKDFQKNQKPMAFVCIAPILAAKVFGKKNGGPGCKITLGADVDLSKKVEDSLGVTVEPKTIHGVCIDNDNRIISTPAYMDSRADPLTVFESVGNMVGSISKLGGGSAAETGLPEDLLSAINNLSKTPEQKQKWIDHIKKDQKGGKTARYKTTFNDPKNWEQDNF